MNNGGAGLNYVSNLSDDELYQKLKDLGDSVGPIVGTTRSLYERRLYNLLNGVMMGLNDAEEQTIVEPQRSKVRPTPLVNNGGHLTDEKLIESRHRKLQSIQLQSSSEEEEEEEEEVVEEQPSTPIFSVYETPLTYVASPRRAFYTGTESPNSAPSKYQLPSGSFVNHRSGTVLNNNFNLKSMTKVTYDESSKVKTLKKTHPLVTTVFEIFVLCFLLVVGYIFYQEILMYSKAEKEFIDSNGQNFKNK